MNGRVDASTRLARSLRHALVAPLALVAPMAAAAQAPQSVERHALTLDDVLRATLAANAQVLIALRQLDGAGGAVRAAGGQFDPQLRTTVANGRDNALSLAAVANPAVLPAVTSTLTSNVSYKLGVDQQLRSGLLVTPEISLSQVSIASAAAIPTSRATASLGVVLPLLKNRWGALAVAGERAAEIDYEAATLQLRHTVAASAVDATMAYWNYLAALRRLEVFALSEQRAQLLVEETEALVAADQRPAADLAQLRANAATKRAQRIGAEQAVTEARQQLAVVMGAGADEMATLANAGTPFPELPPETGHDAASAPALLDTALVRRADLAAAGAALRSAAVQHSASRNDLKPRFDLAVGLSYNGLETGVGFDRAFAPLYRNLSKVNTTLQLRYNLPVTNATARGRAIQTEAALEQRRIAERDLRRRVATGVEVARYALARGRSGLVASKEAVGLSRTAVENERRRFQLGVATLFDVIQAEDALTNALLSEIAGYRTYAGAIVNLRFVTGTLVDGGGERLSVRAERALDPP